MVCVTTLELQSAAQSPVVDNVLNSSTQVKVLMKDVYGLTFLASSAEVTRVAIVWSFILLGRVFGAPPSVVR